MPKIIKTKKLTNRTYGVPALYAFAVLKGLAVFLNGLIMCSFMVLKSQQSNFFYYLAFMFVALGAFLCGYSASKNVIGKGFLNGLASSGIYMLIIFLISLILMKFNISVNILFIVPLCLIPGFIGGNLAVK